MSIGDQSIAHLLEKLVLEKDNQSDLRHQTVNSLDPGTTPASALNVGDFTTSKSVGVFSTIETYTTTLEKVLRHSISDGFLSGKTGTTDDFLNLNSSQTEVTIFRPEVLDSSGIGTAEKVVIGAVIIVVILTILAIILRVCMPVYRKRTNKEQSDKNLFQEGNEQNFLSGYSNIAIEISSQSSGNSQSQDWSQSTGSNPSTDWSPSTGSNSSSDWSEVLSDQTKSTSCSKGNTESDTSMSDKLHRHPGHISFPSNYKTASTTSLPLYILQEKQDRVSKSAKNSPTLYRKSPIENRKYNDEMVSVVSTKSLEPVRMEDVYRNRWDDQWDPYGSVPRGNLSHHSHPSESRLSLNSFSSHSSSVTFPIPSRQVVNELAADQDRRYPTNIRSAPVQLANEKQQQAPGQLLQYGVLHTKRNLRTYA